MLEEDDLPSIATFSFLEDDNQQQKMNTASLSEHITSLPASRQAHICWRADSFP